MAQEQRNQLSTVANRNWANLNEPTTPLIIYFLEESGTSMCTPCRQNPLGEKLSLVYDSAGPVIFLEDSQHVDSVKPPVPGFTPRGPFSFASTKFYTSWITKRRNEKRQKLKWSLFILKPKRNNGIFRQRVLSAMSSKYRNIIVSIIHCNTGEPLPWNVPCHKIAITFRSNERRPRLNDQRTRPGRPSIEGHNDVFQNTVRGSKRKSFHSRGLFVNNPFCTYSRPSKKNATKISMP